MLYIERIYLFVFICTSIFVYAYAKTSTYKYCSKTYSSIVYIYVFRQRVPCVYIQYIYIAQTHKYVQIDVFMCCVQSSVRLCFSFFHLLIYIVVYLVIYLLEYVYIYTYKYIHRNQKREMLQCTGPTNHSEFKVARRHCKALFRSTKRSPRSLIMPSCQIAAVKS